MSVLMVFIDGFGLGNNDPVTNPFIQAEMPFLRKLLSGKPLVAEVIDRKKEFSRGLFLPTDARLNTEGLPQSATGQTTLFTGVNAAEVAGRHINGFPTKVLCEVINHYSIFKVINQEGGRAVFANTFTKEYFETVERGKWRHSVTTTAALAGGCELFLVPDMINGKAVYQDITREKLRERGYDVPLIGPEEAAEYLINVSAENDFTLFEYFQTDHCGHAQNFDLAFLLLNRLDRLLGKIVENKPENMVLLVVSDHGNIEDLSVKTHTLNPVPTMVFGREMGFFEEIETLMDVYPAVLRYLGIEEKQAVGTEL